MISLFMFSMIGMCFATIIIIIENIFHAYNPKKHVSIEEVKTKKLQRLFIEFQNNLLDEGFFLQLPIFDNVFGHDKAIT